MFPLQGAGITGTRVSKNLASFNNVDIDIAVQIRGVKVVNVNIVCLQGATILTFFSKLYLNSQLKFNIKIEIQNKIKLKLK